MGAFFVFGWVSDGIVVVVSWFIVGGVVVYVNASSVGSGQVVHYFFHLQD